MEGIPAPPKNTAPIRAVQWIVLCLISQATAAFGFTFNLPLTSLTNHNTSAFSNYTFVNFGANFGPTSAVNTAGGFINIDSNKMDMSLNPVTPGHVSRTDVHSLIPSRRDLRWFAHATPWFGTSSHINIGLNNNTASYVASMITDMKNRGFNGVVIDWYGSSDTTDGVTQKIKSYLAGIPTNNFTYIVMVDKGLKGGLGTQNLTNEIAYCQQQYFSDPNYEHEPTNGGQPILMFFGVRSAIGQSNMAYAKAATGGNMVWVEQGTGYAGESWEDETFQWTDNFDNGVSSSDPFNLITITNNMNAVRSTTKAAFGAMCSQFNGTLTKSVSWSLGKYLPGSNGLCEVQRAAALNSIMPTNITRMQWPTWSDWEEGTEVEAGIDNNFSLTATVNSGNLLSWSISSSTLEKTIDHYEVYAWSNGVNAALLGTVLPPSHVYNVGAVGLSPGFYQFYVDAVGKPCIRDHLSPPASVYLDMPPQFTQEPTNVTVSYSGTATFSVSVVGSSPFTYTWYDQGSNVVGTSSTLVISNATQNNTYVAVVSNAYGTNTSAAATLTVLTAPVVLTDIQPASQIVWQGDPVTFSVVAGGESPFNYQWTLNGQNILGATNSVYSFAALTGTNAYQVLISNSQGSTNSSTATVIGVTAMFLNPTNYNTMQITFSGYTNSAAVTNFPVLVRLNTNISGFSYSQFISPGNGGDLRFIAETGRELPFQIDQWNTNGESQVWVQVPSITSSNDYVTACWGNSSDSAMPASNTNGMVWQTLSGSNEFALVYHLSQSNFPYADSTLQYPANSGVAPGLTNGIVGNGCAFNGASSFLVASNAVNLGSAFTLSAWVNLSPSSTNIQTIWANKAAGGSSNGVALFVNTYNTADGALLFETGDGTPGSPITAISVPHVVSTGAWHHLFVSADRSAGTAALYVDGVNVTAPGTNTIVTDFANNATMTLGSFTNSHWFLNGAMDEARIESGTRSSAWVWTSWATVAETNFATFGSVTLPAISLQVQMVNGQVVVIWTGGLLQSAPNIIGPYTDMTGATSPYTNTPSGAQQFFRVRGPSQ